MITPPPLPVRRFKFPPLAFLLLAAGWGIGFLTSVQGFDSENVAGMIGFWVGGAAFLFGFPLLITWLLWKFARLRPDGTQVTAWILSAVVVIGSVGSVTKTIVERRNANKRQIQEMGARMRKQRQASLAPEASSEDVQEAQRKTAEIVRESGQKLTGDDGKIMRAMAGPVEKFQTESAAYVLIAKDMEGNPVLDTSSITDLEEIDRRLERVEQMRVGNQKLKAAILAFEDDICEAIRNSGASESKQNSEWQGFQSSFGKQKALMLQIRALEDECAGRMQHVLKLLRDEWGKWHHNETHGLVFEGEPTLEEYNRQIDRIQKIADEETKIQGRMLLM